MISLLFNLLLIYIALGFIFTLVDITRKGEEITTAKFIEMSLYKAFDLVKYLIALLALILKTTIKIAAGIKPKLDKIKMGVDKSLKEAKEKTAEELKKYKDNK